MIGCWSFLLLLLWTCLWSSSLLGADLETSRQQLSEIEKRIEQAEAALQKKQQSELTIIREMAVLEKNLADSRDRIADLNSQLSKTRTKISRQQQSIDENRQHTRSVVARLETRLIALYKEGQSGPLQILFAADSPTEMARQYHYLTRIMHHDQKLLAEYRQAFEEQQQSLAQLQELEKQQASLLDQVEKRRQLAARGRRLKSRLLEQARSEGNQVKQELAGLKEDAARLETLIEQLKRTPSQQRGTEDTGGASSFAAGRGHLGWPVNGRLMIGFGRQQDRELGAYYESNGIEIGAQPGTPVKAVAAGTVVFADYFKGYGNLYIVSHPGGYHSLYAHTDRMQKQRGDRVSAGEILAYTGPGGRQSIYFEIRAQGAPVDPLIWLKKS